jgi:hypothetical protein
MLRYIDCFLYCYSIYFALGTVTQDRKTLDRHKSDPINEPAVSFGKINFVYLLLFDKFVSKIIKSYSESTKKLYKKTANKSSNLFAA